MLHVIHDHDRGWAEWDAAPGLHPESGVPRSFTEMPLGDALPIWSKSITECADRHGWPAAGVAGHFLWLLAESSNADEPAALAWRDEMQAFESQLRAADNVPSHAAADQTTELVRLFDWLSLWLCCYCPLTADDQSSIPSTEIDCPALSERRSVLRHVEFRDGESVATIDPWPLAVETLQVVAGCRRVAAGRYASTEELLKACTPHQVAWRLEPAQ